MNVQNRIKFAAETIEEVIENIDVTEITPEKAINWVEQLVPIAIDFGKKLIAVIIFILIARKIIVGIKKGLEKSLSHTNLDEGVSKFLLSVASISMNVLMVVIAVNMMGIATGSITAILGSIGVTLGLALQGGLSNLFGGVLILIMQPFRIGDYIIAGANEGKVTDIDIFYTKLLTGDNRKVVVPNGSLSNQTIMNVTNEEVRRLDLKIPIEYSQNVSKVKEILWKILNNEEMVIKEMEPVVAVGDFMDSSVIMEVRVWTKTDNYWALKWKLLEQIKEDFDANNIVIPFNQLEVTLKK